MIRDTSGFDTAWQTDFRRPKYKKYESQKLYWNQVLFSRIEKIMTIDRGKGNLLHSALC